MTERTRHISERGPIRVLHVDDDAYFLKTAKPILEMHGAFQVETASCVDEAREKMRKEEYDAVVSDYQMPGKDGLQFLKELRQEGNSIPFIVFTGKGREEVAIKALNLGADHYENKNGNPETVYSELSHDIANAVRTRRAEQELRIQREELQIILDSMPAKIWYKDGNNRLVRVNKAFAEYMGVSKKDLEGKALCDIFPPDIAQKCWEEDKEVIATGQPKIDILDRHESAQGVRWFSTSKVPCREKDGNIIGTINFSVDITENKKIEARLKKSEKRYRQLVENAHEGIWAIDKDAYTTFINPHMAEMLGYSKEEVIGKHLFSFMDERGVEICKRFLERRKLGIKEQHDFEFLRKDGTRVYAMLETAPITDDNGNYIGALASVMDMTERKRVEDALRQSKENFESLAENSFDGLVVATRGEVHVYANKRAAEITGYTVAELLRTTIKKLVHPDESEKILERYRRRIEGRAVPNPCETVIIAKDGRSVPIELAGTRTIWERNPADLVFFRDITERKKAEEALRNSEGRWRSLAEGSPDHIMLLDLKGNILYINRTVPDLKREEVIGTSQFNYVPPEWHRVAKDRFKRVIETGKTDHYDTEYRTKDGEVRYFDVRIGPVFQEDRVVALISSSTDVTRQKKAEKEIESLARFPSENPNPVLRIAKDGIILYANAAAKSLGALKIEIGQPAPHQWHRLVSDALDSGLKKEVEVENEDRMFLFILTPVVNTAYVNVYGIEITERKKREEELTESEAKYRVLFDNSLAGIAVAQGPAPHLIFVNAALSRIWGYTPEELTSLSPQETTGLVHPEDQDIFFGCFRDRLEGKTPLSHYEFRGIRKDGTVVWLEQSAALIEYNGQPAVQATFIDVTERKEALERLRVLNEKLGVVGKLTRHDVRNKLSAIVGNTYIAKKTLPTDHKALDHLKEIESACMQTTRVLDFATAYESLGVEGPTHMDVDKAVDEALSLISDLKGVKVVNNCQGLTVMADSALRQLFFNLIENSLKHGKNASQIKIHYEEGKERLKLFYEDDGVGIPKADKPKLFAGGFTTGNGLGYGLPLIKNMMEIYGWTIEEEGELGKGTKFVITIPKAKLNGKETYQLS